MNMTSNVKTARSQHDQSLRDLIISKIVRSGCACAPDLASQIGNGVKADDLIPVLEQLVAEGVLRYTVDPKDPREYQKPYQVVYELPR